jgi:hypothetical protein
MLSRALSLATVTLLMGGLATGAAHAQATNLEAGKSPSQIFAGTCTACHKSPRGLLKSVPASSLPGFLRQHYTTSSDMASVLSSYLVSNGATDTRYQAKQGGKDAKQEAAKPAGQPGAPDQLDRSGRRLHTPAQEAVKPDADGLTPQGEGGRPGQKGKRLARPAEGPDAKPADGQGPAQAATEAKQGARQKLSKRGKPSEDLSKSDTAKPEEAAKGEPKEDASKSEAKSEPKSETAKTDAAKSEDDKSETAAKPASEGKSETAKVDASKEGANKESVKQSGGSEPTSLRPDPVPQVTPAPPASAAAPSASPAIAAGTPEPSANPSAAASSAPPAAPPPPAVTAAVPPVAPAGPPVPPISQ